ncbi:hypothetical protein N7454_009503 [Penicillium verhagenii]|nr:hypothetical protein N7454_009503 [Penicillium verhagenii]
MVDFTTPQKNSDAFSQLVKSLNTSFGVEIPDPGIDWSPRAWQKAERKSLPWLSLKALRKLFVRDAERVNSVINDFEDWIAGRSSAFPTAFQPGPSNGTRGRKRSEEPQVLGDVEKEARIRYLMDLIRDQNYLLDGGGEVGIEAEKQRAESPKRRRISSENEEDDFHTAPTSPTKVDAEAAMPPPGVDLKRLDAALTQAQTLPQLGQNGAQYSYCRDDHGYEHRDPSKGMTFFEKLQLGQKQLRSFDSTGNDTVMTSFSTVAGNSVFSSRIGRSFDSEITDPADGIATQSTTYADSVVESFLLEHSHDDINPTLEARDMIVDKLRRLGPFSVKQNLPETIPLRYRYELERVGRAWGVPLRHMFNQEKVPFNSLAELYSFFEQHRYRQGKPVPERPSPRAWEAAVGDFKTERHSEVIAITGEMNWVGIEEGIFDLKLNPLKAERTCRFHRRFGSDRFMSLTIPAPSRPPRDIGSPSQPSLLRESMGEWLTRTEHRCLGRVWRAFFIEEVKSKSKKKSEPKFRVEFFAVDGVDFFRHSAFTSSIKFAPPQQSNDEHTPMSVDDLLEWHMPQEQNADQKNLKLFQRLSLGLSKTFVSVSLKPTQVLHLKDDPKRDPVMNDGCALMSRPLAVRICKVLGISGYTPSAFQGRIAGAKGLWMVDQQHPKSQHPSFSENGMDGIWIEISDSQLKIHPHPQYWEGLFDEEKLTFEVVNWSKSLHPVALNLQLLSILEHGGQVKEYVAELTRKGLEGMANDLEEVLQSDSSILCRGFVQKMKPPGDGAKSFRQLDSWIVDDAEHIIRLSEAGFCPQSFFPLRKAIHKLFKHCLEAQVERLHIEVPLSTYAYCIADPLDVLEPGEVHFAFSTNWRDPEGTFQRTHLMDMDVLVGRLPAHVPSDIQRCKAVYKHELSHFQDVIVFSRKGEIPLAHMLSGGDYDGDTPWICWDPNLVDNFQNSNLPADMDLRAEYFGLTEHNKSMSQMKSSEDFLQSAFEFNLHTSLLGRCTIEHEKIAYDESIDSSRAKELACLLSHLVDGRKGGVLLSEDAWKNYRKKLSPRPRLWPAYREQERDRKPKRSNIVDYLKFYVAERLSKQILTDMEAKFPMQQGFRQIDPDLIRPWRETQLRAGNQPDGELQQILREIPSGIEDKRNTWIALKAENEKYSFRAQQAVDLISSLQPSATSNHPLVHTWQNSPREWQRILASCCYEKFGHQIFTWFAFGDVLCDLKTETSPSRSMSNVMYSCYKLNQKMVTSLTASELPASNVGSDSFGFGLGDGDGDEYEGEDAIEALLLVGKDDVGYLDGLEDGSTIQ